MRLFQLFSILFILLVWTGVFADSDSNRVQSALNSNSIVGLEKVLEQAREQFPGRILKVELEEDDDASTGFVYELKILKRDGSVIEVEYDARTLKVLEVEGDDWKNSSSPSR